MISFVILILGHLALRKNAVFANKTWACPIRIHAVEECDATMFHHWTNDGSKRKLQLCRRKCCEFIGRLWSTYK